MAVDVVAEKGWGIRGDLAQAAVRKEAALYKGLEAVAYSKYEATAVQQGVDLSCYLAVVEHVGNELSASVRFVSGGESAAEHKDLAF